MPVVSRQGTPKTVAAGPRPSEPPGDALRADFPKGPRRQPLDRSSPLLPLLCAGLALLALAVYGRVASNEFVDFDDPAYVTTNPHVASGLTADNAGWAFRTGYHSNWHPLTWLSHMLDVELFGLEPAGHHLVSAALHALNAALLLLALHLMTGSVWRSATVAALFALHPLHVESVAWAAERKDVLSTLFFMLALVAYARYVARPKTSTRVILPFLLGLGLLAKPMPVTLPFVLLLLDVWPLGRFEPGTRGGLVGWLPPLRLLSEKIPLFALAAASSVVTFAVQQRGGAVTELEALPLGPRLANAAVAYILYLWKTLWPAGLGVLYPLPASAPDLEALGACIVLAGITAAVVAARRRAPYLLTGWLWYLGTLVPVIGIVQVGVQARADRYTYVPLIGVFLMVAWGLPDLLGASRRRRAALAGVAVVALAGCSTLTWRQIGYWRDSETLFRHTLAVTSGNYVVHNNLGGVLTRDGRLDEAIAQFEEARRIRPDHGQTLSNLGVALQGKGKIGEAIGLYRDALKVNPSHIEAWLNLGNALEKTGDLDGAVAAFREAERLKPGEPAIAARIRAALDRKERGGGTGNALGKALPEALSLFEHGNELRDQRRFEEAEKAYREAIRLDPGFAKAHNNLGSLLGRTGRTAEAVSELGTALELAPDLAEAHNNLGIVLAMSGQADRAEREFAEGLRLDPGDATAHFNLGMVLARQGRYPEAVGQFEETLRLDPGYDGAQRAIEEARRKAGGRSGRTP